MSDKISILKRKEGKHNTHNRSYRSPETSSSFSHKRSTKSFAKKSHTGDDKDIGNLRAQMSVSTHALTDAQVKVPDLKFDDRRLLFDFGAHLSHTSSALTCRAKMFSPLHTTTADSTSIILTQTGKIKRSYNNGHHTELHAQVSKGISGTLLFFQALSQKYGSVSFNPQDAFIMDTATLRISATAQWHGKEYFLNASTSARSSI